MVGGAFDYNPADFLARKWGLSQDGIKAEQEVAREAVKKGYDGIIYGDNEIQDLTDLFNR